MAATVHLMQEIFNYLNIACETSPDGMDALSKIEQPRNEDHPFDLIIADHHMPGMDGIALIKEMKEPVP